MRRGKPSKRAKTESCGETNPLNRVDTAVSAVSPPLKNCNLDNDKRDNIEINNGRNTAYDANSQGEMSCRTSSASNSTSHGISPAVTRSRSSSLDKKKAKETRRASQEKGTKTSARVNDEINSNLESKSSVTSSERWRGKWSFM